MIRILVFNLFLLGTLLYALWRGGAPERLVGLMLAAAALGTFLLPNDARTNFQHMEWRLLALDLSLALALVGVALRADRYWPLYLAAMQLLAVMVHGVRAFDQTITPMLFSLVLGQLAYPMQALLAIGAWRHHRRERARGPEPAWSPLRQG